MARKLLEELARAFFVKVVHLRAKAGASGRFVVSSGNSNDAIPSSPLSGRRVEAATTRCGSGNFVVSSSTRSIRRFAFFSSSSLEAGFTRIECKPEMTSVSLAGLRAVAALLPNRKRGMVAGDETNASMSE